MGINNRVNNLLGLDQKNKDLILYFLLQSQVLEYGITYLLVNPAFLNGPKIENIDSKPLGALIYELKKTGNLDLIQLAEKTKKFNNLRIEIVHYLIFTETSPNVLITDIKEKIELAQEIQDDIDV